MVLPFDSGPCLWSNWCLGRYLVSSAPGTPEVLICGRDHGRDALALPVMAIVRILARCQTERGDDSSVTRRFDVDPSLSWRVGLHWSRALPLRAARVDDSVIESLLRGAAACPCPDSRWCLDRYIMAPPGDRGNVAMCRELHDFPPTPAGATVAYRLLAGLRLGGGGRPDYIPSDVTLGTIAFAMRAKLTHASLKLVTDFVGPPGPNSLGYEPAGWLW